MPRQHVWTEIERQRVAALLQAGRSMRRIGQQFGLTRNAVMGRVMRDGGLHRYVGHVVMNKPSAMHTVVTTEAPAGAKPLFELTRDDCRWPVAHASVVGGHLFCAMPAVPFCSYCAAHELRARP